MEELSANDLKKISLEFRTISSRFIRTNVDDAIPNLKKFLIFIENNSLIYTFIKENNKLEIDMNKHFQELSKDYYFKFELPLVESDEISYTYQLLKYISENFSQYYSPLSGNYGETLQNRSDGFNQRVVLPFVNNINKYLNMIQIDKREVEMNKSNWNITNNNGQLNISNDNSSMRATQIKVENNNEKMESFLKDIKSLKIDSELKEETIELTEIAYEQILLGTPKKSILKQTILKLHEIIQLGAVACTTVKQGKEIIELFESYIK